MPMVFKCSCGNWAPWQTIPCRYCGKKTPAEEMKPTKRILLCKYEGFMKAQDERWTHGGHCLADA